MPHDLHSQIVGQLKDFLKSPNQEILKNMESTLDKSLKPKEAPTSNLLNNDNVVETARMEFKGQGLIANELV